ncbi:hypothetical protein [Blastococcus sp. Marseille-P5729]|uniref:hypothetical protein n=1 Tax=Blastococcus sp. Marseille-P5729 TaxID=2086582 RepID=UPI000D100785|nr:hypothetical protein [Blastococcus sp. Marseille-P5729]
MKFKARTLATSVAVVALGTAGCSSTDAGKTTCSEWHALDRDSINVAQPWSDEQETILKEMLVDHEKDDGQLSGNLEYAAIQVAEFCGVDGSGQYKNADQPIEDGVDWS